MSPLKFIFWGGLAGMVSLSAWNNLINDQERPAFRLLVLGLVLLTWAISALILLPKRPPAWLFAIGRSLRAHPFAAWWAALGMVAGGMLWWGWLKHIPQREHFYLWFYIWLCALVLLGGWRREEGERIAARLQASRWTSPMLVFSSLTVTLVLVEALMRATFVFSDNYGFSLMNARWFNENWKPINALGYRDYELSDAAPGRTRVLVVGDSFAAGHGIDDIAQTFPHVMGRELGQDYTVNVVAKPGWNTNHEWDALQSYPMTPDLLVLAYYVNDITHLVADRYEAQIQQIYPLAPFPLNSFVDHFYLPNFLYWHVWGQIVRRGNALFNDLILQPYADEAIWAEQAEWLGRFVSYARDHHIPLVVIVWGAMNAPDASALAVQRVADYFAQQGATVVRMDDYLSDLSVAQRVVNPFDAHPSVLVHERAGLALAEAVRQLVQKGTNL
ncbi:MAG: hypothetical protein NZ750_11130 [Anaerolineae bacterium]|nr:hypothetical protein [Anaerolineae bacterium]MDW8171616.1 hypothetical protein [Anaerolineae bacterium]